MGIKVIWLVFNAVFLFYSPFIKDKIPISL